jgi:hypothetical protein
MLLRLLISMRLMVLVTKAVSSCGTGWVIAGVQRGFSAGNVRVLGGITFAILGFAKGVRCRCLIQSDQNCKDLVLIVGFLVPCFVHGCIPGFAPPADVCPP